MGCVIPMEQYRLPGHALGVVYSYGSFEVCFQWECAIRRREKGWFVVLAGCRTTALYGTRKEGSPYDEVTRKALRTGGELLEFLHQTICRGFLDEDTFEIVHDRLHSFDKALACGFKACRSRVEQ